MSTAVASSATQATNRAPSKAPTINITKQSDAPASKGTKMSHRQAKSYKKEDLKQFNVPDLTVKDLLSAIPKHCFERSALKSSVHLAGDFAMIAALGYAASYIDPSVKSFDFGTTPLAPYISAAAQASIARFSAWALYTFCQGLVMTGVWIIAHECGHQAFSESKTINNTVGWFLHSALLVPYHSWRISHARHHAATGHLTRDEVFVPRTRAMKGLLPLRPAASDSDAEDEQAIEQNLEGSENPESIPASSVLASHEEEETWGEWLHELLEDAPAYNFIFLVVQQLLGWPMYLIKNSSGQLHFPKGTNHFNPDSIIFDKRHRSQIIMSDVGIALTISALAYAVSQTSFGTVMRYYGYSYLCVNHWLVMITYLQHTDPLLPHYSAEAWTFPRGALCTIDRKWLGPIGPYILHGIAETHVAHHISSKIPHYNAWEATEALKERLGEHYHCTDENVFVSLWKTVTNCKFIEENEKVSFYRNAHGVPQVVAAEKELESDSGLALSE
ncbi:hypothetical protein BCV69DRAFT_292557 [Microstroma glucosiphilum]|uniref:Fatty acid desaturase domain-containing protein n=1 Tax=Pseudomicrostroma glucosiphilum TaxID=1684307 RepID=A0A316UDM3_9BASI|nr:hypothetical protein BCV69DRAFT_292557 [Pseudomicrostroma glucosiphilum]PWN23309.1 hypothetical protein BCV69DRAFT_292557 [Pseudomicrostroma glucosiphilum]